MPTPYLKSITAGGQEERFSVAEDEVLIGRLSESQIVLTNPYISRRHAKLIIDAGLVFIQDLDSTNFSFVDRQKLAPDTPVALSHGTEVRLGKLVMTFLE